MKGGCFLIAFVKFICLVLGFVNSKNQSKSKCIKIFIRKKVKLILSVLSCVQYNDLQTVAILQNGKYIRKHMRNTES